MVQNADTKAKCPAPISIRISTVASGFPEKDGSKARPSVATIADPAACQRRSSHLSELRPTSTIAIRPVRDGNAASAPTIAVLATPLLRIKKGAQNAIALAVQ